MRNLSASRPSMRLGLVTDYARNPITGCCRLRRQSVDDVSVFQLVRKIWPEMFRLRISRTEDGEGCHNALDSHLDPLLNNRVSPYSFIRDLRLERILRAAGPETSSDEERRVWDRQAAPIVGRIHCC
jgi:hypothetical protein